MQVGISQGNDPNGFQLGSTIAQQALDQVGGRAPEVALAFCNHGVDCEGFFRALRSVLGRTVPIIGGSALGIITNDTIDYEGCPAGVALLRSPRLAMRLAVAQDLASGGRPAGEKLAQVLGNQPHDRLLLLFYDSVKTPASAEMPPFLNASTPLLRGIEQGLDPGVPIVGAGVIGDYELSPTYQFCGDFVGSQCAVGLMLGGDIYPYFRVMHGCTPLNGIYHTITRMEEAVIHELDGRPIVKLIDELYGSRDWRRERPLSLLTLGKQHGEPFSLPKEEEYVNRLITGCLPDGSGIGIFEPDFQEGTQIQFMLRDTSKMIESAKTNANSLMKQIESDGRTPLFGLYIDCAGRTAHYSNTMTEEAAEVQAVFNERRVPLFGFHSGVEIAPMGGQSRGLDWTGVLLVLTGPGTDERHGKDRKSG